MLTAQFSKRLLIVRGLVCTDDETPGLGCMDDKSPYLELPEGAEEPAKQKNTLYLHNEHLR